MTAVSMFCLPVLAKAEGKCYDDPHYWKDKNKLVVTWIIPVPGDAKTETSSDGALLAELDARFGGEPPGYPIEYASNVYRYPYPDHPASKRMIKSLKDLKNWVGLFPFPTEPEAEDALSKYFNANRSLYGLVVEHPPVPDKGLGFKFCTCILQRAAILWDGDQQQTWVRSTLRSARDQRTWVNFAAESPIKFSFKATTIWFPLALNRILPDPGTPAFLLLDIVTKKPLAVDPTKTTGLVVDPKGPMPWQGETWNVTRIWRRYQRSDPAEDLSLEPPR
ncbi:MAG TPA: hypothetical protein VFR85_06100 [Anaeromyxobacteraceae bacterium]|nr:hypothetical protein [Anaeromyxobacteraceae bacterium]